MIRGVGRDLRQAVKEAAKTEGIGVGAWVRRSITSALGAMADGPAGLTELSKHVRVLEARLSVLEESYRTLHQAVYLTHRLADQSPAKKRMRWPRTKKSK
jgi:hypothetical protein